jgi:diacylglycerol kinase
VVLVDERMSGFSIRWRIQSFTFAFQGAKALLCTQHNAWIHASATVAVLTGGVICRVSSREWALLVFAIALVWMAEALNTAIEFLADEVTEEKRGRIRKAKDVGAFAVLVSAVAAIVIGGLVFLPHVLPTK